MTLPKPKKSVASMPLDEASGQIEECPHCNRKIQFSESDTERRKIEKSVKTAIEKFHLESQDLGQLENLSSEDLFFWIVRGQTDLSKAPCIEKMVSQAIQRNDRQFLIRFAREIQRKVRNCDDLDKLKMLLCLYWTKENYWLCCFSDAAILSFAIFALKNQGLTLDQIRKARQRLGLVKPKKIIVRKVEILGEFMRFA